jgi:hypothetical protein
MFRLVEKNRIPSKAMAAAIVVALSVPRSRYEIIT